MSRCKPFSAAELNTLSACTSCVVGVIGILNLEANVCYWTLPTEFCVATVDWLFSFVK